MAQRLDKKPVQIAIFEIMNLHHATGYGVHVASSTEADGTGRFPELFLQVDAADRVMFTYLDAGRTGGPFLDISPLESPQPIGDLTALPSLGDATPTLDSPTVDSGAPSGTAVLDPDFGAKPTGLHRFEIDLGPKTEIESIGIMIRDRSLELSCRRFSSRRNGPAREFNTSAFIKQDKNDLGMLSPLFWQADGLISGQGGSGWQVQAFIDSDATGSEDSSLVGHTNTDPAGDPTGG